MNSQIIKLKEATGNVYLETITDFKTISSAKDVESNCVAIEFVNSGAKTAYINQLALSALQSFSVSQPSGCIDTTIYQVSFGTEEGESNLTVIRILPKNQS